MVLAQGIKVDILDDNHLVIAVFVKLGTVKNLHGILGITAGQELHGTCHAQWSLYKAFTFRIFAKQLQNPVYRRLNLLQRRLWQSLTVLLCLLIHS